ncbi:MAG: sucrose-specific PTS transporter subunit IIBC, partial [Streptococcaceae bacterium]|nr:sucrose-specific PTS transporter subunit IIBC [Streptococcaceae bacterium]
MDHKAVAARIVGYVGKENVKAAAHCATRLRLILGDSKTIDQAGLDNDPDLKGTFEAAGQYQIIVGPGDVNVVYDEFVKLTGVGEVSKADLKDIAAEQQKQNPLMALVKLLSDIFVPLIPALVAGGLLMALNNVFTSAGLFGAKSLIEMYPAWTGVAAMINLMSAAPFTFMPVLIGFSATKRFGGNAYLGAAMGMVLVMPALVNGYSVSAALAAHTMTYWNIFGLQVAQAGYQGQVLPVIGVAFILATLEKFFHKHLNDAVDFTFTPLLSILITGFLTFIVVGPALRVVSDGLTNGLVTLYNFSGAIGMGIFGSFYSAIVVTGLHQSFPAIETMLITNLQKTGTGGDFIFVVASAANMAQAGATFAVFFVTKNKKTKALAAPAGVSAILGITEPALFGVNLKYKYPFFIALGASGIASLFMGAFHVLAASLGSAGILGFISIRAQYIPMYLIGIVISFIIAFVVTFFYGRKQENKDASAVLENVAAADSFFVSADKKAVSSETIFAPVSGDILSLKDVKDPVFSMEAMGKGLAIEPTNTVVTSPVDGEVSVAFETGHAYGIKSDRGAEILVHIGIDTVSLNGDGFVKKVSAGTKVKRGDILGSFDPEKIKAAGFPVTTMVIVTNTAEFSHIK